MCVFKIKDIEPAPVCCSINYDCILNELLQKSNDAAIDDIFGHDDHDEMTCIVTICDVLAVTM